MTLRTVEVLILLIALGLARGGRASAADRADDLTVLGPDANSAAPRKMLHTYLLSEAQKQFDARRKVVETIKTPEALAKRSAELREKFIGALGGFPEKTPLNARTVGTIDGDGFRIERVIYESRPGHHVTANLYLPTGKDAVKPCPAVLMPCGHDGNGKANSSYQRAAVLLAHNGIASLSYDPIGQGERRQILDDGGKPVIGSMTTEHSLVGVPALLVGECTASFRIWDGIRSIDYLAGRPEIDAKAIGCTGCSGGGTLTSYLMALDDRITAAAPSCYVTSLERLFATIGPQDGEQNIPGQVAFGMEHADFLTMGLPRATLLCAASKDFFDNQGTWTSFREAKRAATLLGMPQCVDILESDTQHGYPKQHREGMARFMRQWLLGKLEFTPEGDYTPLKTEQLLCTTSGQVLVDLKGKSVPDLIAAREAELAKARAALNRQRSKDDLLADVRRRIALPTDIKPAVQSAAAGEVQRDGYVIRKLTFKTEPGIIVPALLAETRETTEKLPLVLYVHGRGKSYDAAPGGPIEQLVKQGKRVLAVDLRGMGETSPGTLPPPGKPSPLGVDYSEAQLSLHLAHPLLGQRVFDLIAVLNAIPAAVGVEVVGIESAGPIVLHAAALDRRIKQITLRQSLVSWSAVARSPISDNQMTNVVSGALKSYDLTDLMGTLPTGTVVIQSAVDPVGKPADAR